MSGHKYFLDLSDLQYKQVRLPWKSRLIRLSLWFVGSIAVTLLYSIIFDNVFGSPKEQVLNQEIENLKLRYSLIGREIDQSIKEMDNLEMSDENRYRPVLDMDTVPAIVQEYGNWRCGQI